MYNLGTKRVDTYLNFRLKQLFLLNKAKLGHKPMLGTLTLIISMFTSICKKDLISIEY